MAERRLSAEERKRQARQRMLKEKREKILQERKRKKKIQRFLWVELTLVIALVSFICGKKAGEAKAQEVKSQQTVYGSGSHQDEDYVAGTLEDQGGKENEGDPDIDIDDPALILVNKDNKLPDDYEVELMTLPDGVNKASELAYQPLCDMLDAGRKEGLRFEICSSYRSVKRQQELLDEDVSALMRKGYTYADAYNEVTRETMPPGHSEHSTGLAFDIVALDYQMLDKEQQYTDESKWLKKHCAEFGFILRYPDDKEDVTGISFESWHFRYVGKKAAAYIMENGITLEEYLNGQE